MNIEKNQEYITHCEAIFDELKLESLTKEMNIQLSL